jgi:hypothetical protein
MPEQLTLSLIWEVEPRPPRLIRSSRTRRLVWDLADEGLWDRDAPKGRGVVWIRSKLLN